MVGGRLSTLFVLVWLCCSGGRTQEESKLSCEDEDVAAAVDLALLKHNEVLTEGGQLALYEILDATQTHNESGPVLDIRFSSRETDCPAGGNKTWRDCDYLPHGPKVPRVCHVKVQMTEAGQDVQYQMCSVEPMIVPNRVPCLGCPKAIDPENEDLKEPLGHAMKIANTLHKEANFFLLNTVAYATRQVVAGFRYRIQFDMQKSNCSKSDFKELSVECHRDMETQMFMNCNATVDVAPWRFEAPEAFVECAQGALVIPFSRRRPPGWSPLRTIPGRDSASPDSAVKIKESESEESHERTSNSSHTATVEQPSEGNTTAPVKPFNCPSKPWKQFTPIVITPPPQVDNPEPDTPVEGGFSDLDLLG